MKQKKDYTLIALLIPFLLAVMASYPGCYSSDNKQADNVPYSTKTDSNAFHVGDILLPDYSHSDTLIVESIGSAETLNMIFDGVNLPVPATDSEIDSVLHKYCRTFYHTCKWVTCPYKGIEEKKFGRSVTAYVGNSESEAYSIDILHLFSPHAEYDELEEMLKND